MFVLFCFVYQRWEINLLELRDGTILLDLPYTSTVLYSKHYIVNINNI